MSFSIFIFILLVNFWSVKSVEIPCESVEEDEGSVTCYMREFTAITSDDVKISDARNENISSLSLYLNREISFLPIEIHEKMPNLTSIVAPYCSISTISKKNFIKLSKLNILNLSDNKIEKIESDTFDDLLKLENVYLQDNRIKFINGKLFERKRNLEIIDLSGNLCIDERTTSSQEVHSLLPKITVQCGFDEGNLFDESNLLEMKCGIAHYTGGLIIGGNEVVRGQWPFLVALILTSNEKLFCGGNLISSKHILTAAHCLHGKNENKKLKAEDVAVLLGRHDLNSRYERSSEQREVAEIIIHPNWKNYTQKFDSDLAILILKIEVQYSEFIQPVCLPNDAAIIEYFDGTVVGWGKSESEALYESIPRQVSIRAVNSDVCFEKDPDLGKIYSRTAFCAGGEGAGPCKGDSGGGFYVHFRGLWTLRGIVSAGSTVNDGFGCDVGRYNLFTKLIDFLDWIKETVKRS